ncbi:hypothetical protein D0T23_13895 [Duganella sp. BJB475]|nr:hypothetical protein D0T23_13895 [Duganella sp. BJB475]RFP31427.1 hypothetical protein D0T21_16275 [Duganella sp. BJB476]
MSARSVSSSVTWRALSTEEINSQDDYQDGFNATYYLAVQGKDIGYAEKGAEKGILFDHKIYPVDSARALSGFAMRPTELNPYVAEWGTVTDSRGKFGCVSFPFGVLGQSGSFQKNRSAYLLSLTASKNVRILYSATGNIDVIAALVPKDIQNFILNADECDHTAGEFDGSLSEQRQREIERAVVQYCRPAQKQLKTLKAKYKGDAKLTELIRKHAYDSVISFR